MSLEEMDRQVRESLYRCASGFWYVEHTLNADQTGVEAVSCWVPPSTEAREFLRIVDPLWRPAVDGHELPQAMH